MSEFKVVLPNDLSAEDKMLIGSAREALLTAYAPYSSFHVGAAALLENGVIVTGTNQENAAYPSGMCAERVLLYAVASQYPGAPIRKLAVVAVRNGETAFTPATCCGACRQVMLEFEHRQKDPFPIIMYYSKDQWIVTPSAESLLPFSFKKSNLDKSHLVD